MSELIRREDAINAVEMFFKDAYIEDSDVHCTDMEYEINHIPAASPWHRVEDELPEPIHPTDPRYKAYLICDSLGYMHVADYTYSKHFPTCYSFHVNGEEVTDVKYWMPIEPPKEGV